MDGNSHLLFNERSASDGARDFCISMAHRNVKLDASSTLTNDFIINRGAEKGGKIGMSVLFDVASCEPGIAGAKSKRQVIDFKAMGLQKCHENMYKVLATMCSTNPTWPGFDSKFSLLGGAWGSDCALWSLRGMLKLGAKQGKDRNADAVEIDSRFNQTRT